MSSDVPIGATCATCRWCALGPDADEDLLDAFCHYNPPTDNGWPGVHILKDFCAQWETDYRPSVRVHPTWSEVRAKYVADRSDCGPEGTAA